MRKAILAFILSFLNEGKESSINIPALLIALVVLFIAFGICMTISSKNKLYIKQKKEDKILDLHTKNEVA